MQRADLKRAVVVQTTLNYHPISFLLSLRLNGTWLGNHWNPSPLHFPLFNRPAI
jgi:hypothetical protein